MSILFPQHPTSILRPATPPPSGPFTYDPYDAQQVRDEVYSSVLDAAQKMQPIENTRHRMLIRDVNYDKWVDPTPDEQKKAILAGTTIGRRLVGTVDLVDKASGKVIDSRKQTLAQVPHLTERGTFIFGGNEYAIGHQKRQKAGLYARVKKNGQTEVHANILPGKGVAHRYALDPSNGIFSIEIQQAKIPLLPLLKAMGVKQSELEEAWGAQLVHNNLKKANDAVAMSKLFDRVVSAKVRSTATNKDQAVIDAFHGMEMDDYVNSRTLKRAAKNLDRDVIMDVTKRLLAIAKHEATADNRDDLYYQTTHGPADLFAERISKDYNRLRSALFRKASMRGNLSPFTPGALSKQINSVFLSSGLAQALEEINPGETLDKRSRITSMGEGGLSSLESIPENSRNVQDSYYGLIDPVRTPESLRAGVDVHLTNGVRRSRDGKLYATYRNLKTGKMELKSSEELADATLAFPGELAKKTKRVLGIRGGKFDYFPREEMEYEVPHFEAAFSPLANLVPMKSASKPHRMAMASRMLTQALPLQNAEAPLVQAGVPDADDESYEGRYGTHYGAVRANKAGRVVSINDNRIKLAHDDGTTSDIPLHNNFVFNRKTMFHQTPVVQQGQTVKPGDLMARSNYTDHEGTAAIGKNLRVGYMAYEGANFEDAICISETAAKQYLRSEHAYQHAKEITPDIKLGKKAYLGVFADKYPKAILDKMDDGGVIKPGQEVMPGDPLILGLRQRELNQNRLLRGRSSTMMDNSETWDHHNPGIVTDVHRDKKGITVVVKSYADMEEADKLSGRYGDKGVISKIIPDAEMPRGEDGKPLDILVNPLGLNSRVNSSQVMEAALGKIAARDGKPYKVKDFGGIEDLAAEAFNQLKQNGMSLMETVYDPKTGKNIPNILVGNRFFMKLHHTAESKGQARATGGYTADDTPAKGGATGSKRLSLLDNNALLAHGAYKTMRAASLVRGQRNDDYWLAFMQGINPPTPRVPRVYEKFIAQLRGSGVNAVEDGPNLHILAMTDKDIDKLAEGREITNGETVKFEKDMEPIAGGLFDPKLTGGGSGNRWAYISLPEPYPSPVMEEPIRRVLGLTQNAFNDVLAGREKLPNGETGPGGIHKALENFNLDDAISAAKGDIKSGRKTRRDDAIRKLKYLMMAKERDIHPRDWMLTKVPVLPPIFRPVSKLGPKQLPMVADANYLYRELLEAKTNFQNLNGKVDDLGDERLGLYAAFKAVTGLGDPVHPKLVEKNVKGLLKTVFGSSPKTGTVQQRLLGATVDMVGRAVVLPNPDLDMDSLGIPEKSAWELYKFFTIRRLRRKGMPLSSAMREVKEQTPTARSALLQELEARPVTMVRAPVLHKFGVMAFRPRLVKGDAVHVSPLIVKPYTMDFDGDAVQYHVASTDDEVDEAYDKLLPSRNLISPSNFKTAMYQPTQEYTGALYTATAGRTSKKPRIFSDIKSVLRAFERGDLDISDPVQVK